MDTFIGNDLLNIKNNRIKNELRVYLDNNYNKFEKNERAHLISIENDNIKTIANFLFYVTENKITFIKFIFHRNRCYPFYPPDVMLYNKDYHEQLAMLSTDILKFSEKRCLCCESILCKDNWFVVKKLNDIFNEIERNIKIKLRIQDRKNSKYVVNKKIGTYVPIIEFL